MSNENKICPLFLASPEFVTEKGCECRKEKIVLGGLRTNRNVLLQ